MGFFYANPYAMYIPILVPYETIHLGVWGFENHKDLIWDTITDLEISSCPLARHGLNLLGQVQINFRLSPGQVVSWVLFLTLQ